MKIKWLGHASFLITSDAGIRIITDPYMPNERLTYNEINESAEIVTASHGHSDHNNVAAVQGNPQAIMEDTTTEIKGIKIKGIPSYHDDSSGSQRGENIMFCFEVDGVKICHLGDLGHQLGNKEVTELGKIDVLLIPVGGNFTIDARVATDVCNKLTPKVIIPMHYKNERCGNFPVSGVDEFLEGKKNVTSLDSSEVELKQGTLPAATQIIVLKPAL